MAETNRPATLVEELQFMLKDIDAELSAMLVTGDNVMHVAQSRIILKRIYDGLNKVKEETDG